VASSGLPGGAVVEVLCNRDRLREFPSLELLLIHAGHESPRQDVPSSCRLSGSPEGSLPQLVCCHAHHFSLRLDLVLLFVGHPKCRE
jgi:hypothetical protein